MPGKGSGVQHTMLGGLNLGASDIAVSDENDDVPPPAMNVSMAANIGDMMKQGSSAWADAKKANERLLTMLKVATAISSLHEPEELLNEVMSQIFQIFPQADRGFVMLQKQEGSSEMVPALIRKRDQKEGEEVKATLSKAVISEVVEKRNAVLTSDAMSDERFSERMSIMNLQIRSMMSVPLMSRDEVLGMMHVDSSSGRSFTEDDLNLLNTIAPQVSIAIKNVSLMGHVKEETERRASLARYLSPDLVDQILDEGISLSIGGEMRYGTVFFSDIIGFTPLTKKIGAEAVMNKLNRYFHVMEEIIFRYQGTIDKFQGDAIMAFWGVLAPLEFGELQAVQAALEMQNAMYMFNSELDREGQDQIQMGIGLNSGEFVAGNLGSEKKLEFTVIGENVNLAARIESKGYPYVVLISESTFQKVRAYCVALKFPPIRLKGIDTPVGLYAVRGILPKPDADPAEGLILCAQGALVIDGDVEQEIHVVWGRDSDEGIVLDLVSHYALPPAGSACTLKFGIQEKETMPPAQAVITQNFEPQENESGQLSLPRIRINIEDPDPMLMELMMPGSVLTADMGVEEIKRGSEEPGVTK